MQNIIIAECCQNHKGDLKILKDMVWAAAEAGANYAKIQSMLADDLTYRKRFETGIEKDGKVQAIKRPYQPEYARLKPMDLDDAAHHFFTDECSKAGIKPLTTAFSRSRIPFLSMLPWREIKVASYDCASLPFLKYLSQKFAHLFISTGSTYDSEIEEAANLLSGKSFTFLHCVTIYPTPLDQMNFARFRYLKRFTPSVGFSDHSLVNRDGIKASVVALLMGANVIERHFTILPSQETKDGPVSINPDQLRELVAFSKMQKDDLEAYVHKYIPEYKIMLGYEHREMTRDELLNRDYYRGRFATRVGDHVIYNWESTERPPHA